MNLKPSDRSCATEQSLSSFASKVRNCTWIYVSTTCGSGWVDDEHAILLWILNLPVDPPATAGGTDPDPTAIADCLRQSVAAVTHEALSRLYSQLEEVFGVKYSPQPVLAYALDGTFRPVLCFIAPDMTESPAAREYGWLNA